MRLSAAQMQVCEVVHGAQSSTHGNHIVITRYSDSRSAKNLFIFVYREIPIYISPHRDITLHTMSPTMPLDLDEIIKALSHPVRREILTWLRTRLRSSPTSSTAPNTASVPGKSTNAAACRSRPSPPTWPPAARGPHQQPEDRPVAFLQTQRGHHPGVPPADEPRALTRTLQCLFP